MTKEKRLTQRFQPAAEYGTPSVGQSDRMNDGVDMITRQSGPGLIGKQGVRR